ncbi:hypothetical protein [Thermoplasma volcanium]|nr:hypothetical protein [Thermoplasma volcanium]
MTQENKTISKRSEDEVLEGLLRRIAQLKRNRELNYRKMANSNVPDNVRSMMLRVADMEEQTRRRIEDAIRKKEFDVSINNTNSYAMIEHIVKNSDVSDISDVKSVLLKSMKEEEELHRILEVMSKEYNGTNIEKTLRSIIECEENNKNALADLYEDYVNEGYW